MRSLFRRVGLVTLSELQAVEKKLRAARERLDETAAKSTARRDDVDRYKKRVSELEAELDGQSRRHRQESAQAAERIAALERRLAGLEQKLKEREARADASTRDDAGLEARVTAAMAEFERARGDLASVEVKLNILEGAANALDARLRAAGRPLPATGDGRQ